ncbi:MAG: NAD(P)-dependent oxidoreductase [Pseudomonadota bacterium]
MALIVVGGGGFVGLNIVEHALAAGRAVILFDITPPPDAALTIFEELPGTLRFVAGDVRDASALAGAVTPDVDEMVYGAAVTAGLERDRAAPEITLGVNLDGFLVALRAAQEAGVRRVINLSSAGAYGAAAFRGSGPLREEDETDPQNIYGITKFASERVGTRLAEVWGLDVISVRLSGVFGNWERRTGVRDTPSPHYQILEALRAGRPALVERADARDWIYAPDVARIVARLLAAPSLSHRLYNVSTGMTWSVSDWGAAMAKHFPGGLCRLVRPGETPNVALHAKEDRRTLSIDRLHTEIGDPRCITLEQSVKNYADWAGLVGDRYI